MKKLLALILTFAFGMSLSPSISATFAQDYDPSELYQEFLRQLQEGEGTGSETSPTSEAGTESTEAEESSQPEVQPLPVMQPISVPSATPLTHKNEVRMTGKLIEGNAFHLMIDPLTDVAVQGSQYFTRTINHDPTSWYYKDVFIYSSESDFINKIIRAAHNDPNNRVRITGWGETDSRGVLKAISVNSFLTEKAAIENIKNPNNPEFSKDYTSTSASEIKEGQGSYYGFIFTRNDRAWMKMTNSAGVPILDADGKQVERILMNSVKWRSPFTIANVDYNDKENAYLTRAKGYAGDHGGLMYLRYETLDVVELVNQ